MASSLMQWLTNPRRNWFAAQHYKALCNRLKKYGLRYDDLYDPMSDLDIKEALARLPREVVDARNQRLKRAMDLSMKHEYLPEDLQALQTPFRGYLKEMLALPFGSFLKPSDHSCTLEFLISWISISNGITEGIGGYSPSHPGHRRFQDFSFDALFGNLVNELLPSFQEHDADGADGGGGQDALPNGTMRGLQGTATPMFPAVEDLLALFKDSCKELVDLRQQIDGRLQNLKKEVEVQDAKHRQTLAELEKGVDGLHQSFQRLDSRISSVGQTAAKIGDHLQSADSQRKTASQTIELIKYLMEFNSSPGDLMELSPLFSDDSRVAEAASIAQKLPVGAANASRGLEVAVGNLQDYCNELENRLLSRFDAASQRRELSTMAECAKILSQFNRGTSAMQHYVASRPMFIDVEVMNTDINLVLGDQGLQAGPSNIARGLSTLYKEITDTVRKEAATIMAVFPSPNDVMSILVQRVLEQRVSTILDRLLEKPSLVNLPPVSQGGLLLYLRIFAVAYEKTEDLAKELQSVGCGDLDAEGLTESLFLPHKDEYPEYEQASLQQLYQLKMEELRAEAQQQSESTGTISRSKAAISPSVSQQISVTIVTEFVRWNEEAISRCTLFSSQPTTLAGNVRSVFACLLGQVSQYLTEGLERARESLNEAAALRDRFVIGASVSRRVAAAAASAAEAAAAAGESSFRSFMIAVQRCASSVAILQQYFSNTISRLLPPDAHAASLEEMGTAVSSVEGAAQKGLQQCIETVMAEVERLLSAEQKTTDYRTPDDGNAPDHRPTNACIRVVAYLSRVLESAFSALEGLNKQSFLTDLGNRLHKGLINHWQKFTFSASGGLRLKRDITEYGEFVRSFNAPSIDENFELLGIVANVFIVAPESLASLFEGTPSIRKDALRFIQLRDDFKTAKISSMLNSFKTDS
ncbi:Exocyst complex component Sec10 [Musa troglodytarum]|uniref:Complex III subunit VII n=1 Tax=Musa troglodytarum TaxID=320322 RepID=A0A9E7H9E5_9LILI|nr:Exocyst complex component Sec10 [Musa troglodytarum]